MRTDLVVFPARALGDRSLTRAHLIVLYHLGRHADFKTGWAWPSINGLAEAAGVGRMTVVRALDLLEIGGYIRKEASRRDDGGHGNNRYLVALDPPTLPTEPPIYPSDTADTSPPPSTTPHSEARDYPSTTPQREARYYPSTTAPPDARGSNAAAPNALDGASKGKPGYANTHITPIEHPIGESPAFQEAWATYPKRPNNSRIAALRAWRARVKAGEPEDVMLAGTRAYATQVEQEGREARFVKLAATFYGPDKHYLSDFTPAPRNGNGRREEFTDETIEYYP